MGRMIGWAAAVALVVTGTSSATAAPRPIDRNATRETRALFANLHALAPTRTLFGHQDDLSNGYGWDWQPGDDPSPSDVKKVSGSYPAVTGWDFGGIFAHGNPDGYDEAHAARLRAWVRETRARGGLVTFSWHEPNPASDKDAWDVSQPAVARILPGGDLHDRYLARLDIIARFVRTLTDANGRPIPIVFRPFHETTGEWFWWGRGHATAEEYKALWRMMVTQLRDRDHLHQLLYAYSTDVFRDEADYLDRYPGDAFVDVLGFDDYHSIAPPVDLPLFETRLRTLVSIARARGKLPALTETGLEALPDPNWWTGTLLKGIDADATTRGIAWVLVWRNANPAHDRKEHFFAPYPDQKSAADFVRFHARPDILFEDRLPDLYTPGAGK